MQCKRINQLGWRCKMRALKGRDFCAVHQPRKKEKKT